jgi:uncharacterized membrane protein
MPLDLHRKSARKDDVAARHPVAKPTPTSLGIVTIAICKAFLGHMSGLEGLLRALSFIASLVTIGLAYQRLLRRETKTAASRGAVS